MFKGTYRHRIDGKGRLPVPAVFRRGLPEGRVVVTPLDQCLAAYPPGEWAKLEAQLAALPAFSKPVKALTRLIASRASDCEIDVQGRILLQPALRTAAGRDTPLGWARGPLPAPIQPPRSTGKLQRLVRFRLDSLAGRRLDSLWIFVEWSGLCTARSGRKGDDSIPGG